MRSDFLQRFLNWSHEVVEAAENPAARLAAFLLPILAPIVPAFITSIRMTRIYTDLSQGLGLPEWIPATGAVVTALVLELLGWVGTIALVRFIYAWIKERRDEYLVPMAMVGFAYLAYVVDLVSINSQITKGNNETIILLLALLTIPAGLVFAVNLASANEDKKDYVLRQENREDKLKAKAIKAGINIFAPAQTFNQDVSQVKDAHEKHASDYREKAIEFIERYHAQNGSRPSPKHLTERFNLEHSKNKGYMSSLIKEVCDRNGW